MITHPFAITHDDKETNRLVAVYFTFATDTDCVVDFAAEEARDHVIYLGASEPHASRFEHPVASPHCKNRG